LRVAREEVSAVVDLQRVEAAKVNKGNTNKKQK
jgi:hypothetical protein